MFFNAEQVLNAHEPIVVTLSGIVIFSSDLQPLNAPIPILVTLSGILMWFVCVCLNLYYGYIISKSRTIYNSQNAQVNSLTLVYVA